VSSQAQTPANGSAGTEPSPKPGASVGKVDGQASADKVSEEGASGSDAKASATPPQSERVIAAAPPAPAIAPVDFSGTTIDNVLEMRVAVAKDVSAIGFATSGSGVISDLDGNVLKALPAETAALSEIDGGIVVDGEAMPSAFWIYPEDGGYVAIGDSWFRGRMLIALRERGLIAVNYVLLGDYLYSVVGTEMSPGWALESLKAQAVAARSYALTHNIHPASEAYFDLDNTQRFQAYKGIDREASSTQLAVQATAGEFISHDGGIVESLYAASQAIVDDAHKGMGMSQLGAKDLAEQGYSYQEILAHYYPGTGLGRIETDHE
ncbi:MAG: SpoIID/LytB domain-containing protein, partial [Cyanobacteria bacterium J06606_4]